VIKTRIKGWAGDVACIEGKSGAYRGNLRERDHLEDLGVDEADNVKVEIYCIDLV
jgi:hypothetical protein